MAVSGNSLTPKRLTTEPTEPTHGTDHGTGPRNRPRHPPRNRSRRPPRNRTAEPTTEPDAEPDAEPDRGTDGGSVWPGLPGSRNGQNDRGTTAEPSMAKSIAKKHGTTHSKKPGKKHG